MGALSGMLDGFLMGRNLSEQRKANKFMGNMLMGQSSPEEQQQFAQLNPQQYMQAQGQLQQQEQAQQAQAQRARQAEQKQMIQQVYSAAVSGDEGAMRQLASVSSTLHKQAMDVMAAQGKSKLEQTKVAQGRYKQGSGTGMAGMVFDTLTGEFKANPEIRARLDAMKNKEGGLDYKDIQGLNKDFTSLLKDTTSIYKTANDLTILSEIEGGAPSIAMVYKFMKALDPASVVREGEFAIAENSSGVPDAVRNYYNKLAHGERLSDSATKNFVHTAQLLANNAIDASSTEFGTLLDTYGETIPAKLKDKFSARIPTPFEIIEAEVQAPQVEISAQRTPQEQTIITQLLQQGITQEQINQQMGW